MTASHIHMLVGGCITVIASVLMFVFPKQIAEFFRKQSAANRTSLTSVFPQRFRPTSVVITGILALILGISLITRALSDHAVAAQPVQATALDPVTVVMAVSLGSACVLFGVGSLIFRKRRAERFLSRSRIHDPDVAPTDMPKVTRGLRFRIIATAVAGIVIGLVILTTVFMLSEAASR